MDRLSTQNKKLLKVLRYMPATDIKSFDQMLKFSNIKSYKSEAHLQTVTVVDRNSVGPSFSTAYHKSCGHAVSEQVTGRLIESIY